MTRIVRAGRVLRARARQAAPLLLLPLVALGQVFPGGVADDGDLLVGFNLANAELAAGLDDAATTFAVDDGTGFGNNMVVVIDAEAIFCATLTGDTFSGCTRGFDNTTAAAHSSGAGVSGNIIAHHHNSLKDEVKAIETALGASLANVAAATHSHGASGIDVDAVGTSELDDGADTPLSGEYVRVDTVDQAGIEYRTAAEVLADIGGQASDAELTEIAGLSCAEGEAMIETAGSWACGSAGGAPGADSITTIELDDDTDTPVAGERVIVRAGATDFEYESTPDTSAGGKHWWTNMPITGAIQNTGDIGTNTHFHLIRLDSMIRVTQVAARVITGSASQTTEIAVYALDSSGVCTGSALLTASINAASAGNKSVAISEVVLDPGYYYLAWTASDTAVNMRGYGVPEEGLFNMSATMFHGGIGSAWSTSWGTCSSYSPAGGNNWEPMIVVLSN